MDLYFEKMVDLLTEGKTMVYFKTEDDEIMYCDLAELLKWAKLEDVEGFEIGNAFDMEGNLHANVTIEKVLRVE